MRVSVAMATYNGASYLQEQLKSFEAQTRLPDELVIADDASTDDTVAIIEAFAEKAPFEVRYSSSPGNLGYAGNFDRALHATSGDLILLSDQDDVWFPEKLERMAMLASQAPEVMLFMNDALLTDKSLVPVGLTKLGQIRSAGLPDSRFVMGCCAAVRRELLDLVLPVPPEFPAHDEWIVKFAEGIGVKYIHEEVLQYYRRHGRNESQFLANTLAKIGRFEVVRRKIKEVRDQTRESEMSAHESAVERSQAFLHGIARACDRCHQPLRAKLLAYAEEVRADLEIQEQRRWIHTRNRLVRIPYVLTFLLNGKYRRFSGVRSALRDIVTPRSDR